jgi:biotin-dependent carboxylase-like uncharacterized protein
MAALVVIAPGARSTVQDLGFRQARGQGVPAGGVMDRRALLLLNALLGDPPGTEAIEVALLPPVLRAEGGAVRIALGGTLRGRIIGADGTARPCPSWTATTLREGETLHPDPPDRGGLGLIGVAGGIEVPRVLGSRSTCLRAGFGGVAGRALRAGDRLGCCPAAEGLPALGLRPPPQADGPIRIVPGPQGEWFAPDAIAAFCATPWGVTAQTDRMGMRLDGPPLAFAAGKGADIVSDGIAPGAVQVPGNGRPIVLLADAQTTGGYAKIATVIGADLPRLAAAMPGDTLRFAAVDVAAAEAAARAEAATIARAAATIGPRMPGAPDPGTLMALNLVDGMIDMARPDHFPGHLG